MGQLPKFNTEDEDLWPAKKFESKIRIPLSKLL